jgi:hypothetical protein
MISVWILSLTVCYENKIIKYITLGIHKNVSLNVMCLHWLKACGYYDKSNEIINSTVDIYIK